eukprot:TRINITY_DN1396_c0_g1_i5.p1 TRINITY_DN1396_c0_g1~~TRINITY_DN1396_c0_g1_i5.p1  ORF type:complete len:258 (+),score=90.91 TRINITY_DN1396_c0_g1_i5:108-776(+)
MARGHRVQSVPEFPLVISDDVESVEKTKEAVEVLKSIGALADVNHVIRSKKMRAGKGKMRNRRWRSRRDPLIVYNEDEGIVKAFRNIPGVELCQVSRLNLLQLAPGAHLGRFIIWTQSAFERLDDIYGTDKKLSSEKHNYKLPRSLMSNIDLVKIINSSEIQGVVRPAKIQRRTYRHKKNPLKNLGVMVKLNPYALTMRRLELIQQSTAKLAREKKIEEMRG